VSGSTSRYQDFFSACFCATVIGPLAGQMPWATCSQARTAAGGVYSGDQEIEQIWQ
jgi:hypothetical protein